MATTLKLRLGHEMSAQGQSHPSLDVSSGQIIVYAALCASSAKGFTISLIQSANCRSTPFKASAVLGFVHFGPANPYHCYDNQRLCL